MGLMGESFVWIGTDAVAAKLEMLSKDMLMYRGILAILPYYGKGSDSYNELKSSYKSAGGNPSDFGISSVKASQGLKLLHHSLIQLSKGEWNDDPSVNCESTVTWPGGTQLFHEMVKHLPNGTVVHDYDIMNFKTEGFVKVGSWSQTAGLTDLSHEKVRWMDRKDVVFIGGGKTAPSDMGKTLTGYHLRIGIIQEAPIAFLHDNCTSTGNHSSPTCWYGWNPDIIKRLAQDLNFTYEYIRPKDEKYGAFHKETNSWNGMIKDVLDSRVDLTIALSINTQRAQVIGYTAPFYEDQASMVVYLKSAKSSSNMFFFLEPFELSVWACIIGLVAVISVLMAFLSKLSSLGSYGRKIHALQACSCAACGERREMKGVKKCRFVDTMTQECLVDELDNDKFNDLCLGNSIWLIGTG